MSGNSKTSDNLKECMSDALIGLMKEKDFARITVADITEIAGVHRSTWFRNFSCKTEAVTYKLVRMWFRWAVEHGISLGGRYTIDNASDFFGFSYENRDIFRTIYDAGQGPCIYDAFYQIMRPQLGSDVLSGYRSRFYSYGLFGMLDEWIKRDFLETPGEMAALFLGMLSGYENREENS